MDKTRIKNAALIAVVVIIILAAAALLKISKKEGIEVEEIGIKEIIGNTPEERLAAKIDVSSAKITKIEDADELRNRYSAIFNNAENGNYVVEMPDRLLIYDFEHDEIIAEFYVQNIDLGEGFVK